MAVWSHCAQAHAIDETEAGVSRSALVTLTVSSDAGGIAADRAAACPVLVLLSPASCEMNLACVYCDSAVSVHSQTVRFRWEIPLIPLGRFSQGSALDHGLIGTIAGADLWRPAG